jgi:hypothetical protein
MREIFIDAKYGNDSSDGSSCARSLKTTEPLKKILKKIDPNSEDGNDRLYVRVQHAKVDPFALFAGHDPRHHVLVHEQHLYVDGVNGDDGADGESWETALRSNDGVARCFKAPENGEDLHVEVHVRNITGFRTSVHQQIVDEMFLAIRAGDEPKRRLSLVVTGYRATE